MSLISIDNFTKEDIQNYINNTEIIENQFHINKIDKILKGKMIGLLFYEPSTRTRCSFEVAIKKLGGETILVNELYSSHQKGESIEDTIKTYLRSYFPKGMKITEMISLYKDLTQDHNFFCVDTLNDDCFLSKI
jgi:aspartate carbamoyltransferase catalytic subunit